MQPNRRRFLCLALGAGASGLGGAWLAPLARRQDLQRVQRTSLALGTTVSITALHEQEKVASAAIAAAFAELELVEEVMSLYRPHSQLSRLNHEGVLKDPHPYLLQVLRAAQGLSEQTGGAFDVTVQPLWSLYATAHKQGLAPTQALAAVQAKVDWRKLEVSPQRVRLARGMAVTLNGIAQGFAADRALAALRQHGIQHALVNTGEIASLGAKRADEPWTAGIQHPRIDEAYISLAKLDGRCLATSGDYATSFSEDHRDNHILDPRTGRSPTQFASVSVLAESGLLADGLSTAIFVVGRDEGLRLIEATPGADALFVLKDGRVLKTPGFPEQA
jgi:thiamine biosynthesis lipoprotein